MCGCQVVLQKFGDSLPVGLRLSVTAYSGSDIWDQQCPATIIIDRRMLKAVY